MIFKWLTNDFMGVRPSVSGSFSFDHQKKDLLRSYATWPFIVGFAIKMVIFHSYVSLPECIGTVGIPSGNQTWQWKMDHL